MTLRSNIRVRVRVRTRIRVRVRVSLTLTKSCSNKIGSFCSMTKWGNVLKIGGFSAFFMLNICLSLKIELFQTFPTHNSYCLVFQKTFSLQPLTSFLWQWRFVGIGCSISQASVHVTGLRWVLVTGVRVSDGEGGVKI